MAERKGLRKMADKVKVGTVARLVLYPVKSMRGIDVPEAQSSTAGLRHGQIVDRLVQYIYGPFSRKLTNWVFQMWKK